MALTKVSAAMFSTAAQTSDLNLDDGTLFVDSSENKVAIGNTTPAEALDITGNLTLRSRGYVKLQDASGGQFVALRAPATVSSNVTWSLPAADGSSGQSLVTDGSGALSWQTNYLSVSAGTGVTVSSNTISIGQAVATSDSPTFTNLTLSGNLTVNGSTVTNSATNTTIEDLLIELGTGTSGSPSSDAGIVIERGSSDNVFMGWDESADVIVLGTGSFTGASSGNLTITPATLHVGSIGIGNAAPDVSLDMGSKTDAVHLPVGTTAQRPGSPAAGYFRYNSTLSKFEGYTTAWGEIGGGGSNSIVTDTFTGNGSTVDFTLSSAMSSVNNLIVFVDGVYQNPDAYSLPAATTLRFSAPPANSRKIIAYGITGVVTGSNLNIDSFTGDGSDLTFTLSITPVNENNTLVYVGGVYQQKSVYSVSGTTLTFGSGNAPPNGASIEVATFNQTDINVPVDNTITTVKLVDANVTTAKIADNAVTADKIVDNVALPGNISTTGTLTVSSGNLTVNGGHVNVDAGMSFQWGDSHERIEQSDGKIEFFTNNTEKMVLSAGKLGIATDFSGGNANSVMSAPLNIKLASGTSAAVATFNLEHLNANANVEQRLQFNAGDDATAESYSNMGYVAFGKENIYQIDSTRDSYLSFATSTDATQAERMRITSAGNVGIGTTSPGEKLEVGGTVFSNSTSEMAYEWQRTGVGKKWSLGSDASQTYFYNATDSVLPLSITNAGKVGIGLASPSYTFTVEKAVTNDWLSRIYNTGTAEGDNGVLFRTGSEHDGTALLAGYSGSSYKFYLQADGNLGIGTTAPSTSLDIVRAGVQPLRLQSTSGTEVAINMVNTGGNVQLEAHSGNFTIDAAKVSIASTSTASQLNVYEASNSQMQFQTSGSGTGASDGARFGYNGSGAQVWNFENNYVRFATNNTERVRITDDGKVGIGSSNPYSNAALTVIGGIRFSTNVWASGNALNVTSWATYNNNNENSVGAVYNKLAFLTIYHSNGQSMIPIVSNAGGGVAYQFTCIRPDSASAEHGAIDFTVTTDGSAGNAFRIRIGSGNGNLSVERTSGSTTFGLALHVLSG